MYVFIATRRMHSKNCLLCSLCEESQLLLTFHNQANKLLAGLAADLSQEEPDTTKEMQAN